MKEKQMIDNSEKRLIEQAQRELVRKLENELKTDKKKQIEKLQDKWRNEKERFDTIVKDDGYLEQKIMEIYKKNEY